MWGYSVIGLKKKEIHRMLSFKSTPFLYKYIFSISDRSDETFLLFFKSS